jgi:hypothetical protein
MKKIRLIRTMILEFEPDPDYYPEGSILEEMAEIEYNQNFEDRDAQFSEAQSDTVTYEIIE